jgi:hypothetical protein
MAELWPNDLPQEPLLSANGFSPLSNIVEFSPDVGPPIRRQRATLAQSVIQWDFHLTYSQKVAFLSFYETTLRSGSAAFVAKDPFKGDWAQFIFEGQYSLSMVSPDLFKLTSSIRRIS